MRKSLHAWLAACLFWAFVQAPFAHTHDRDPHHEHDDGTPHTHLLSHHSPEPEPAWQSEDHSAGARSQDWVVAPAKAAIVLHALLPDAIRLPRLTPRAVTLAPPAQHNHDPPWRRGNLRFRAPPA